MQRLSIASFVLVFSLLFASRTAHAETLQAPVGGRPVPLGDARVACGPLGGGWTVDGEGHALRPPADEAAIGKSVEVKVAPSASACATPTATLRAVTTGRWPIIDGDDTSVFVDEARLDLHGRGLRGASVVWKSGGRSGEDRCSQTQADGAGERCALTVGHGLPADVTASSFEWRPAGAVSGPDVITFDADGRRANGDELRLTPGRFVISTVVAAGANVDLAGGTSRVPLTHAEAVSSVDCGSTSCALEGGAVVVRSMPSVTGGLSLTLRLAPHVYARQGEALEPNPVVTIPVLPCSLSVASGAAPRGVDDARIVVRVDGRCGSEAAQLRYQVGGRQAELLGTEQRDGASYILLRAGRIDGEELAVTASRPTLDPAVVGAARLTTRALASPHPSIDLEGVGAIDFIPTNRSAIVRYVRPSGAELVLLAVEGVYETGQTTKGETTILGQGSASGFVALRFGLRAPSLPGRFATTDLAVLVDPIERPMHEANVPAPLVAHGAGARPLVELLCGDASTGLLLIPPGGVTHIPFGARDSCRVVLHRERLSPVDGVQKLSLDVDVTRVDGTQRPEGHVSQTIVLRAGDAPHYAWIKGVSGPFDRISVRIAHQADESHYVGSGDVRTGAPAEQWAVVAGTSRARLYATTAIPTGLYRVSDSQHSGILTLNLGVIARLTWLDSGRARGGPRARSGHDGARAGQRPEQRG